LFFFGFYFFLPFFLKLNIQNNILRVKQNKINSMFILSENKRKKHTWIHFIFNKQNKTSKYNMFMKTK